MGSTRRTVLEQRLRLGLMTGVLFVLSGLMSGWAALPSPGLEALWPANALVFGILIAHRRSRDEAVTIIAAGGVASVILHLIRASPAPVVLLFAIGNVIEWIVAYILLRRMWRVGELLDRVGNIFALVAAAAGGLAVAAHCGATALWLTGAAPYAYGFGAWFAAGLLGYLLVTPTVVIAAQVRSGRRLHGAHGKTMIEVCAVLGLVAAVTAWVFLVARMPATFVVAPCVLLATFRFRAAGAVAAMAIVTAVAIYATSIGHGPIAHLLHDPAHQVLVLQLFLAATFIAALPVAAMLTERDLHAEEARLVADHFRSVVENIGEVIFRIDRDGRWVYLNPAWETLSGLAIPRSIGRCWTERFAIEDRPGLNDRGAAVLSGRIESMRRVLRLETRTGPRWVELFVQALHDPEGGVSGATGTLRDIDDRKRLEENVMTAKHRAEQRAREATRLASTDELTGIANRRAFMTQLDREIAGAAEFGWPLAVAMFDVDHFKAVNDSYGHAVGDRVLQMIALRAAGIVRGGDLVGRLGGEEFGILMPGATADDAAHVAERLREAMETGDTGPDALPRVTVSVGIASRERQRDSAALLAAADAALYEAKGAGRNRVRIAA
jgi:diguanylate cyclase (GGDEF)-like protein/PAS domain S-box-containing protein